MVDNSFKVSRIIDKLLEKTKEKQQTWKPSLMAGRYQARFGSYTVEVQGILNPNSIIGSGYGGSEASIKVTKLDGEVVVETVAASTLGGLISPSSRTLLDPHAQQKLNQLYNLLADRGTDLDELLRLI